MTPRGAGYSLVGRDKPAPEDRWALAELDGLVLAAVADGLSDPDGTGRPSASGALADHAVAAFVDAGSRLAERGERDPAALVAHAFAHAADAAHTAHSALSAPAGAAFIGACLDAHGTLALAKVGDCRALVRTAAAPAWAPATPSDDADPSGLTAFLGPALPAPPVVTHRGVDAALLMSDGAWRLGAPPSPQPVTPSAPTPFALARELVSSALRAGEADDLTAVALTRAPSPASSASSASTMAPALPLRALPSLLSPLMLLVGGLLFFLAGALVAAALDALGPARAAPARVHHVLILDDSGSMETDFDVHGFGLAIPQLFHRLLAARPGSELTVLTLAQGLPFGPVPRLSPADYLEYARENGTHYGKAIDEALALAAASSAERVAITLITDAEPEDARARRAIDAALKDPRLSFRCFQLGTTDPGDLCLGRTAFAASGFDLAKLVTQHLAQSFGSLPRWGLLDPAARREESLPLGRYVSRLHVLMLGARAGEDFMAELRAGPTPTPLVLDHTRPMMPAEALQNGSRRGPRPPEELPVGPSPRLALGTLSLTPDALAEAPRLRLLRADGPVAWGVILEYDLQAEISAPNNITATATTFQIEGSLTHRGIHVPDAAALGFAPRLEVAPRCEPTPCPPLETPVELGADGRARATVPADPRALAWTLTLRFTSDTADLPAPPATVTRDRPGTLSADALPAPPPTPPTPPPATTPPPAAAPPTPPPTPAASPTISRWIPPTLDLPDHVIEGTELGYALTVIATDGKALTGAQIQAEGLTAALVLDGARLPMTLVGDRFELRFPVGAAGPTRREATLELRTPTGPITSNRDAMDVLPDQALRLLPTHDLGEVDAGCGLADRCAPLDLSGSRRLDQPVEVLRERAFPDLRVTLRHGDALYPLEPDAPARLTLDPALPLEACVSPPSCAEPPADASELVTVRPADPRLQTPDRLSRTRLVLAVRPSTWLACNLWWIVIVGGALLFLVIAWGYLRPHAFSAGAILQVADQERRLAKDPGRPLRTLPHGRRGFYRTATCALDASGYTVKRTRPHVVLLKADRRMIALFPRGAAIERRQRGQWVPLDRQLERHVLSGVTYRVNQSFVFRVLA